jgi:hypothetical protein
LTGVGVVAGVDVNQVVIGFVAVFLVFLVLLLLMLVLFLVLVL